MNKLTVFVVEETAQGPVLRLAQVTKFQAGTVGRGFVGDPNSIQEETIQATLMDPPMVQKLWLEELRVLDAALTAHALREKDRPKDWGAISGAVSGSPGSGTVILPPGMTLSTASLKWP